MSLKAGRVGVNPADVDPIDGHINPSSLEGYTKEEADAKFETLEHAATLQSKILTVPIKYLNGSVIGLFNTVEDALSGSYGEDGAMTNEQLTQEVNGEEFSIITTQTINTNELNNIIRQGKIVCVCISLSGVTAEAYETIASVPASIKPAKGMYFIMNGLAFYFDVNGNLKSTNNLSNSAVRGQWVYCL